MWRYTLKALERLNKNIKILQEGRDRKGFSRKYFHLFQCAGLFLPPPLFLKVDTLQR